MEGVGQLIGSLVESDDSLLDAFLHNLNEHQSFWKDPQNDLDAIFTRIGTLLAGSRTRDRGLKMLIHLLSGCPLDLVEDKAQFYMNLCMKVCEQRGPIQTMPLVYQLLQQLIHRSLASNDLHKLFVSNLPKLLESVGPKLPPPVVPSALTFLELAMQHYAGACGPAKSRIETFLYSLVDSTNSLVRNSTARCLLLLQQIRGGGQHGSLHKRTWEEYYRKLVDTIHDLLNQIFVHTPETFDEEDNLECLKLPPIANTGKNPIRKAHLLAIRAINMIACLDQAIVGAYPVARPIAPFKALNLILRGLSVSCETMGKNPLAENIAFGTFLPSIHYGLLEVLDGLVLALGTNMLMYGDSICDIFPKCLKATQTNRSDCEGTKKSFTRLRSKIYESIQLWCEKMRYGSNIEMVNEPLLEQIVRDFTPYESEVTLKMGSSGNKRLSSRAKRKLQKEQNAATALNQNHSSGSGIAERKEQLMDAGNETLCRAALDCLSVILQSAGCFIKPITHKLLEEKIVPLCFSLVSNHQQLGLYGDEQVRVALLRTFAALIVNPHHHCPPPLQYASYIFNTLQTTDSSTVVRSVAAELARTMELVVHPWKETLYFPADKSAIKDALANKDKHPLAMLTVVKERVSAVKETNGELHCDSDILDAENPSMAEPQNHSSPKESTDAAATEELAYESEGEINESLAVTEASDDSIIEDETPQQAEPEPATGWVEHVSISSLDDTVKGKSVKITTIPDDPDCYDAGVIQCSEDDDDKPEESAVVSIMDSEEEQQDVANDDNEDDVVEVATVVDLVAQELNNTNSRLKNTITSEAQDDVTTNGGSTKKAKLSTDSCNSTGKAKNIDDIVNEMVAEFVDEP
ncbi:proline-, glutamic acid- and leucine-rich protein 1-like [Anopheles maculipalpis]|uniref:proline-, glutamic acid- and leucine-rich protein 1-like n=1 Tax=Anopheles maculipalpis TaxID=1496333 RepID=UPI002158E137|nr:proline-, glutamic acid- and leucine-rich protein 1-like [Anopheles maculipalpis]